MQLWSHLFLFNYIWCLISEERRIEILVNWYEGKFLQYSAWRFKWLVYFLSNDLFNNHVICLNNLICHVIYFSFESAHSILKMIANDRLGIWEKCSLWMGHEWKFWEFVLLWSQSNDAKIQDCKVILKSTRVDE